ncbi:dTDP-glucose 4,6-dehydratase, partial [Candidatus Collierbacteria bacterium RIFOXYD1_FULL_40_9]
GSNFIHYWLEKYPEDKIINLDLLTYSGHLSSLETLKDNPRYSFTKGDICNIELVDSLMNNVDTVIHFAAESHVDRSILDPQVFVQTNIMGTQVLLESAKKHNVKRFHHISTDEVFGSLKLGANDKFSEETAYDPRSPYSASKASSDHLVRAYFHTFNLPVTITNCSNNFGPFQDPEKFIPRMVTNLLTGQKVKVYGDGLYVRDWLFVEDHCRAIDLVVHKGEVGQTYCVGGQTEDLTNLDLTKKILKIMNLDETNIEFVTDRPGHDRRYAVNWSKINTDLGWSPSDSVDNRLKETVNWYKENENWWRPLKEKSESIYQK